MKTLVKTTAILVMSIILTSNIFAQSSANASATVTANLKKGLSMTAIDPSIDFGEIILTAGSAQSNSVAANAGAKFQVVGHPGKAVNVTFANASLDNNSWVLANGGSNGSLTFVPSVEQTGGNSTYASASAVSSGNSINLVNNSGDGYLYLWVGGSIDIASNQPHGDYTGTFTITVAY